MGPYHVVLPKDPRAGTWVTLVEENVDEVDVRGNLVRLRKLFAKRGVPLEVEFNEAVLPRAGKWLEASGMKLIKRNPLMACTPGFLRPFKAPEVNLTQLEPGSTEADLQAFQTIRWTEGNLADRPTPPVELLRKQLEQKTSVYLLAWLDGEPAGTGVSHRLKRAAEVVGIVTRADRRRRGVASTVSSELVSQHFDSGGDFVFLDAASDEALRVYERLGFTRFGTILVYRWPGKPGSTAG